MQEESVKNTTAHQEQINLVFANCSNEDMIYLLTVWEISKAHKLDASMKKCKLFSSQLADNIKVLYKHGEMVIPVAL